MLANRVELARRRALLVQTHTDARTVVNSKDVDAVQGESSILDPCPRLPKAQPQEHQK
ncbi:hypothetical protein PF010_g32990 [Phytophthora fragariae]|uniref:Uncharacterized protein n=1 Tax=Phytophthora fragariae TaxID=53985 RepID=A0A6G0JCY8_9STRA|nr:hypothetical protein PF010_g32990 [Phytophthora fragariae]